MSIYVQNLKGNIQMCSNNFKRLINQWWVYTEVIFLPSLQSTWSESSASP